MKTPRDILLETHRAAEPRLDDLREAVLATEFSPRPLANATPERSLAAAIAFKIWGELIWPSRRAWAGLAAIWVVLAGIYLADRNGGGFSGLTLSPPNVRRFAAWGEQQHLLTLTFAKPPAEETAPESTPVPAKSADSASRENPRWA